MNERHKQHTPVERLLLRLYEVSLRMLPPEIQRRWAVEMTAMFSERLREAAGSGGSPAVLVAGGRELGSIALAAFQSRVGQASGRVHRAHDAQDGSDVWRTDPVPALFHREDRRPLKLATMGALACHFALFLVVFPGTATPELVVPRPEGPLVLQPLPLPPPPTPEAPAPVRGETRPMPTRIAEPVRFVPRPVVDREALDRIELPQQPASAGFEVGVPVRPPAPPRARVRAGVDVQVPQLLERVEPVYPQLAVRAGIECVVTLEAVIGKAGRVIDAQVLRGCRLGFDESALAAMQQWRFTPSTLNGRPVEVIANFTVRFRLH